MSKKRRKLRAKQRRLALAPEDYALTPTGAAAAIPQPVAVGKYGNTYTGQFARRCSHWRESHVFDIGQTEIWAGMESQIPNFETPALIIDCSNLQGNHSGLILPAGYEALAAYQQKRPVLQITWPDGGVPAVAPQFWPALVKLLPAGRVYVCCIGSHGRTGTALAAMRLQCTPAVTVREAIEEIRRFHCEDAIETQRQIDYLYEVGMATGGLDMVNDGGKPRPKAPVYGVYAAAPEVVAASGMQAADTRLPTWSETADACTDSADADMLENWPLDRTMTAEEIDYYRAHDQWPSWVYYAADAARGIPRSTPEVSA